MTELLQHLLHLLVQYDEEVYSTHISRYSAACCLFRVFQLKTDKVAKSDKQQPNVDAADSASLDITSLEVYKHYNPQPPTQPSADTIVLDDEPPSDDATGGDTADQQTEEELEASLIAALHRDLAQEDLPLDWAADVDHNDLFRRLTQSGT